MASIAECLDGECGWLLDEDEDEGEGEGEPDSEGNSGSGSGNESGGEDEAEAEGDDEEITMDHDGPDPKHHPLLRAGALPKMSRAAMDAAVELVMGDLVVGQGKARQDEPLGRQARDGRESGAVASAGDDDEEDELED